jgi:hypothetical protein
MHIRGTPPQQPWLAGARPGRVPDDFSTASATQPLRRVLPAVLLALLVVAMGRSAQILDLAYGLDTLPGTDLLISAAEASHVAMQALGIPQALAALHAALGFAE